MPQTNRELEERIHRLEKRRSPREQFLDSLLELINENPGSAIEVVDDDVDVRGPLGGRSQQARCIFTDAKGREHGVIINAYVGKPDVHLTTEREVIGRSDARRGE